MSSRITLKDIASKSGYSRSTVSLVMQNNPVVAEDTRIAVQQTAEELGYVYNRAAASLRSKQSGIFGLVVSNVSNPFFGEMILGIEKVLGQSERTVLLGQHSEDGQSQERMIKTMLEARVDGLLLVATRHTSKSIFNLLDRWEIPTVLITRRIKGSKAFYVGPNNIELAEKATDHLFEHKRNRIAFIGGQVDSQVHDERLKGVIKSAANHGFAAQEVEVAGLNSTREGGYKLTKELISKGHKGLGILAYNDIVAFGAMAALRDANIEIGKDISIIGFDDVVAAKYEYPALTSVHLEPALMGELAAETILKLASGEQMAKREIVLEGHLIIRQSCGCNINKGKIK